MFKWLENALDCGISEQEFWNMTIAEVRRVIESKNRVKKAQEQERASFDYKLADLIGKSIARIYNSANKMPELSEVYPTLFDSEEIQEKKAIQQDKVSTLRFMQFAASYNKKYKEVANK